MKYEKTDGERENRLEQSTHHKHTTGGVMPARDPPLVMMGACIT